MKHTWLLIATVPSSAAHLANVAKLTPLYMIDACCTQSYVVNSGVTEPNFTKYLYGIQKLLPINLLKWDLHFGMQVCRVEVDRQIVVATVFTQSRYFPPIKSDKLYRSRCTIWRGQSLLYTKFCLLNFTKFGDRPEITPHRRIFARFLWYLQDILAYIESSC